MSRDVDEKYITESIRALNLVKIYGKKPNKALELLGKNVSPKKLFETTNHVVAVNDVTFDVKRNEVFVIMGSSGSGKSTLVRMVNRLIELTSGKVYVDGQDVTSMAKNELRDFRRTKCSMVFQHFALLPHYTALENAAFALEIRGISKREREEKAMKILELVGLEDRADSFPHELSGGMQQRIGLARALSADTNVILMDEPFSALDPLTRTKLQDEFVKLQQKLCKTILLITHDLSEAIRVGNRIAIMKEGKIVQLGTAKEILERPADDYVQEFTRELNRRMEKA